MKRSWIVLLIALLCLPVVAQDDTPKVDPALAAHMDGLDAITNELRELPTLESVTRLFPTRDEVVEKFTADFEEELTDELIYEANQFYRAFDFVEVGFDLEAVYTELIISQIGGFYDPETKEMNVLLLSGEDLSDTLPGLEQIVYVHEYTHALQDQHFDLAPFLEIEESDEALAALALVEGDATLVMQLYTADLMASDPSMVQEIMNSDAANAEIPEGTPAILEAELTMPYLQGLVFVSVLYNSGGWEAVNAAYENPPISTEQIMHPVNYINGDAPIPVELTVDASTLGDDWTTVDDGVFGEFYLRQYLLTQLRNRDASDASAGWGGDHYALYHNEETDAVAWNIRLTWDTPEDSAEFLENVITFGALRAGEDAAESMMGEAQCWVGMDAFCVQAVGDDVMLSLAPDVELALVLIEQQ